MTRVLLTSTIAMLGSIWASSADPALSQNVPPDQTPPIVSADDSDWTKTYIAPGFRRSEKAIGSDRAKPGDWPFLGVLRGNKPSRITYYCGATAISRDWVLTAAHCLQNTADTSRGVEHPTYGPIEIVLGVQDLATARPTDVYRVTRVILHPDYRAETGSKGSVSDIALMKLDHSWTGDVAYLSAGGDADSDGVYARGFIAGFGRVIPNSDELTPFDSPTGPAQAFSRYLMHAMLPMKRPPACVTEYQVNGFDPALSICAGFDAGGIDSCQGDSGGPLGALDEKGRLYQVGIVSHGYKCGVPNTPAVYTRVSHFAPFIRQYSPDARFVAARPESAVVATQETLASIIALLRPSADRMKISVTPEKLDVREGEYSQFTVRSTVAGRIWVLDISPQGVIEPVYPDPDYPPPVEKTFVNANEPLVLPRFKAGAPFGKSRLIAMVLPKNVELIGDGMPKLDRTKGPPELVSQDYAMRMLNQITRATGVDSTSSGNVASWSSGEITYSVKAKEIP